MSISMYSLLTDFLLPFLSGRELLPVLDLPAGTTRHIIVAQRTKDIYNGRPGEDKNSSISTRSSFLDTDNTMAARSQQ